MPAAPGAQGAAGSGAFVAWRVRKVAKFEPRRNARRRADLARRAVALGYQAGGPHASQSQLPCGRRVRNQAAQRGARAALATESSAPTRAQR